MVLFVKVVVSSCSVSRVKCNLSHLVPPNLILDLPGRGYSSTPDPDKIPQDSAFFNVIILIVIASSMLSWTGRSSFCIIGYSLGGGIAVNFASFFSNLVSSVVLLAPSGLIRPYHFDWHSKLLYSKHLLPESILEYLVYRRLNHANDFRPDRSAQAVEAELPVADAIYLGTKDEPTFDIAGVVVSNPHSRIYFPCNYHGCTRCTKDPHSLKALSEIGCAAPLTGVPYRTGKSKTIKGLSSRASQAYGMRQSFNSRNPGKGCTRQ